MIDPVTRPGAEEGLDPLYADFAAAGPGRPRTYGHLGQSLDGAVAAADGRSHYVTGPENLDHLHRMRALADAVVIGAGTAVSDDPRLTVRRVPGPDPLRVVLDSRGGLPSGLRLLCDGAAPTLVVGPVRPQGVGRHVDWAELSPGFDGRLSPRAVLDLLHARRAWAVFVEGGGVTVSTFLAARVLDRLQICVAPLIVGEGRRGVTWPGGDTLDGALRAPARWYAQGRDCLCDLDLRGSGGGGDEGSG